MHYPSVILSLYFTHPIHEASQHSHAVPCPIAPLVCAAGLERVGERSPQLPQGFVPVARSVIYPGDKLKVTCDFDSTNRTTPTMAGGTHNDEMCNM